VSEAAAAQTAQIDHLVVACRDLAQAAAWCEATFGVAAAPGGQHPLMGTHNLLLNLSDGIYFEMIAIDPSLPAPAGPRWFGLDDPAVRATIDDRPQLVHWVARASQPLEGDANTEVRDFERSIYRWQMALPRTGDAAAMRRLGGCLPLVIHWKANEAGEVPHPTEKLPASHVRLKSFSLQHPDLPALRSGLRAIGFAPDPAVKTPVLPGTSPMLSAEFDAPSGPVVLTSPTL
jgi:hypothetical protein